MGEYNGIFLLMQSGLFFTCAPPKETFSKPFISLLNSGSKPRLKKLHKGEIRDLIIAIKSTVSKNVLTGTESPYKLCEAPLIKHTSKGCRRTKSMAHLERQKDVKALSPPSRFQHQADGDSHFQQRADGDSHFQRKADGDTSFESQNTANNFRNNNDDSNYADSGFYSNLRNTRNLPPKGESNTVHNYNNYHYSHGINNHYHTGNKRELLPGEPKKNPNLTFPNKCNLFKSTTSNDLYSTHINPNYRSYWTRRDTPRTKINFSTSDYGTSQDNPSYRSRLTTNNCNSTHSIPKVDTNRSLLKKTIGMPKMTKKATSHTSTYIKGDKEFLSPSSQKEKNKLTRKGTSRTSVTTGDKNSLSHTLEKNVRLNLIANNSISDTFFSQQNPNIQPTANNVKLKRKTNLTHYFPIQQATNISPKRNLDEDRSTTILTPNLNGTISKLSYAQVAKFRTDKKELGSCINNATGKFINNKNIFAPKPIPTPSVVDHSRRVAKSVPWDRHQARRNTNTLHDSTARERTNTVIEDSSRKQKCPFAESRRSYTILPVEVSKIKTETKLIGTDKKGLYFHLNKPKLSAFPEMSAPRCACTHLNKIGSTEGYHLNFDNVANFSINDMIYNLSLLSDSHNPSIESTLNKWCSTNIKISKIFGQILFLRACKMCGIVPEFLQNKFRTHNWSMNKINLQPIINQCLKNEISNLEEKKSDLKREIFSLWTDLNKILKPSQNMKLDLIIHMAIWKRATYEIIYSKHVRKFNILTKSIDHICNTKDTSISCQYQKGSLKIKLDNINKECKANHYPWDYTKYVSSFDRPASNKQLGSIFPKFNFEFDKILSNIIKFNPSQLEHRAINTNFHNRDCTLEPPKLLGNKANKINEIEKFLEKVGPNFAIPSLASKQELSLKQDLMIDRSRFAVRWKKIIELQNKNIKTNYKIPFENVIVSEPAQADTHTESKFTELRKKISDINALPENHIENNAKNWKKFNKFLIDEKLMIVSTDKTKRNKLLKNTVYNSLGRKFLAENPGYSKRKKSNAIIISKKSNDILDSILSHTNIPKRDINKLKSKNSKPSNFYFLIKDHKNKNEDGQWPIRPIASIHNTPVDGIDWLTQQIIQQLLEFIPAHIKDGDQVISEIHKVNLKPCQPGMKRLHLSLDVVNLYPSIPTKFGINCVIEKLKEVYSKINTWNIPITCIKMMLEHIFNNYEIIFDNQVFLQTSGAPMGARSSVALSIIVMHFIETQALNKISKYYPEVILQYYGRYIDDTLLIYDVPIGQPNHSQEFLMVFNAINDNIQFTMEEPPTADSWLPFLDTQIAITNNTVLAKWYQKPLHSGNMLDSLSFVDWSSKGNFLKMCFTKVRLRSNYLDGIEEGYNKVYHILIKNGYEHDIILENLKRSTIPYVKTNNNDFINKIPIRIPFQSNTKNRSIKKAIGNINLPIVFINDKINRLSKLGYKPKPKASCLKNCKICKLTKDTTDCGKKNIVYELSCKKCLNTYIGMTNRTLKIRMTEHASDILYNKINYGPNAHLREKHPELVNEGLSNYCIEIKRKCNSHTNTKLTETRLISMLDPAINKMYLDEEIKARNKRNKKNNTS